MIFKPQFLDDEVYAPSGLEHKPCSPSAKSEYPSKPKQHSGMPIAPEDMIREHCRALCMLKAARIIDAKIRIWQQP